MAIDKKLSILIALCSLAVFNLSARAGDFSHICTTVDGNYEINPEAGELTSKQTRTNTSIKYQTLSQNVITQITGYCIARGNRYEFETKSYVIRIGFTDHGQPVELEALCELSSNGLPASDEYKCERQVITRNYQASNAGKPIAAGPTRWNHNGSTMQLIANGVGRQFVYMMPRLGMVNVGARPGDIVFEGTRDGQTYSGTAYIFSKSCGRVAYMVAGNVSADERSVLLEGQAPLLDAQCQPIAYRRDQLRFDLIGR